MTTVVTLIDYGVGNLLSVRRAFEHQGAQVRITDSPMMTAAADRLVLPGVGAFAKGMEGLRRRGLDQAIREFQRTERPLLGICLGMQLFLEESAEFGRHPGLGLIPGKVAAIPRTGPDGHPHVIPHIGWNALQLPPGRDDWQGTILAKVTPGEAGYFVHSYAALPTDSRHCLAVCDYHGLTLTAAIGEGPWIGCQFHPEKSGPVGLRIIDQFLTA